jgi:hypothetical protein
MWKNTVQPDRSHGDIIWRMRIACWMPKATNTHSEYAILIAFPLQQWLRERGRMLRHTHCACTVAYPPSIETIADAELRRVCALSTGCIFYRHTEHGSLIT